MENIAKRKVGFNNGEFDRSWYEEIGSITLEAIEINKSSSCDEKFLNAT